MNADAVSRDVALKYLRHIEALAEEIEAGMTAVGGNALSTFQASVARQQEICTSLCQFSGQVSITEGYGRQDGEPALRPYGSDPVLAGRILQAAESLQVLNERYAALLKHSGESVRLFAGLCRSYRGQFEQSTVITASRPAWSYES